ncbi:bifunctional enoyl-CoA hydratase/phosphate acetyltransferase [Alsobacter metallidurans]|uniref:Bifunctional enoyl-CoA hydratase/phosphate acetyltransferase n=1 Tax=Alsobacter metallidurans TaxID=340221 RepID=A0A917MGL7_9HYPH|nr:bifunctional enoyl-CoA hydratase/phosphate acetyltransferase [Alsobacter metallidurans]GGH11238.1 bifunctional enoyl-CoA hydratase/phosphate acetyltransferase [Alsobacter metallidurans]
MSARDTISNRTWDELEVGDTARVERVCAVQDLILFAHASGNTNPLMLPSTEKAAQPGDLAMAPSLWVGSLISAVLGNILPGAGTVYRSQSFRFPSRVHVGDRLLATVKCVAKRERPVAVFETTVATADGRLVCEGTAEVETPLASIATPRRALPQIIVDQEDHFAKLFAAAAGLPPLNTAVVCPDDRNSLEGAALSARSGLIRPILIGDEAAIRRMAAEIGEDISAFQIVAEKDSRAAAAKAVSMVRAGEAAAIMKGNIHSDELLAQVVKKEGGLRTQRRISHCFVLDVPTLEQLLFVSDAAINIAPDLTTKVDIVQNAINLAQACGIAKPRVGVLSAVETVNVNIPSTLDAAILSKMADRGQIKGAIVDGPLAMDNAIDLEAAQTKGIASLVAGRADILIVPNLEAGNMLAKELTFVARAEAAGLVLGASAPVMLTSRADDARARKASCALALLYERFRREGAPARRLA